MINRQVLAYDLNLLLDSESRSLLRHLDEAHPYVTAQTTAIWGEVKKMVDANRERSDQLSALIRKLDLTEQPGVFESTVANYHFMAVEKLIPKLVTEKQEQLAAYRRVLEHASGEQVITAVLEPLVEQTQSQLQTLEGLVAVTV